MNVGKIFIGILCAVAVILGFVYKRVIRKQTFKDRKPMTYEEIYNVYIKEHKIGYETFIEVYNALSDAYAVNSKLIRPTDSLKIFFDIDSWDLDAGTEKMEKWLAKNTKIEASRNEIKTVLDLLIFVEASRSCIKNVKQDGCLGG